MIAQRDVHFRTGAPNPGEPCCCIRCDGPIIDSDRWLLIGYGDSAIALHDHCRAFAPTFAAVLHNRRDARLHPGA